VPQVIPVHTALRSQLRDSVQQSAALLGRLELLIAVKTRQQSEHFHGKIDHSQPPWNAQAAGVILDMHAKAREMEAWLRLSQGLPPRPRGGSDGNTCAALENIARLAEAAEDATVRDYIRDIEKWVRDARVVLGETERPKRLPRLAGKPEPRCPFCENHTLRMWPLAGKIFCIKPDCKDEDERKPQARMEYSTHVNDWVLVWQDGLAGVPV
jgi:hypothetical protein